jgi:membrane protease YdiL (CAAX protease family)
MARKTVDTRSIAGYLILTYGISWGGLISLRLLEIDVASGAGRGVGTVVFMGAPAIAAILVLGLRRHPIRSGLGLYVGRVRWLLLAWIAPAGLTAATIGLGFALTDLPRTAQYSAFLLELGFMEGEAAQTIAELEATGIPLTVLLTGLGLVLGATLFALAAIGEELGWRGFLLTTLAPLGFWKVSLVTGLVWGIWHAPLVVFGLQFPGDPLIGIVLMTAGTVALSPIYTYLTVRAGSVLAPTFFHGSFVLGVFTSVYLGEGSELLISPFGVLGIGAAMVGIGTCVAHDRLRADRQVITGEPLRPWTV